MERITFAQPSGTGERVSGGATRKATNWMLTLAGERDTSGLAKVRDGHLAEVLAEARAGTFDRCSAFTVSQIIDRLKAMPKTRAPATDDLAEVLKAIPVCGKTGSSKYALPRRDGQGVCFLEVRESRGTKRRFINLLVGAPGSWSRQPMSRDWQLNAARKIAADPLAASKRYGTKFTACGYCGSPLSDPDSVTRQIGPVCITRF